MFKKISALTKFELNITLNNKFVFVYTLIFPVMFLLLQKMPRIEITMVLPYWAYIIVTLVINGVVVALINMRENGFLKMFAYMSGSKWHVFIANVLSQSFVCTIEVLVFNVVYMLLSQQFVPSIILLGIIVTPVVFILVSIYLSPFLLLPLRTETLGVIVNGYLLVITVLLSVKIQGVLGGTILLVNPIELIQYISFQNKQTFMYPIIIVIVMLWLTLASVLLKAIPIHRISH